MDALGQHCAAAGQERGNEFGRGDAHVCKERADDGDGRLRPSLRCVLDGRHAWALPYSSLTVRHGTRRSLLIRRRHEPEGSDRLRRALIGGLIFALTGLGSLAGPALASAQNPTALGLLGSALRAFPAAGQLASKVLGNSLNLGSDGRLTVLIAGSDFRYTRNIGERFDALIVATINPDTKQVAAIGIPRDTGNIPLPDPHDTYHGKVNSLLGHYKKIVGSRPGAIEKVREAIAYALQIEIDYVVVNRFPGFDALVDAIGGVNVDIPLEIRDPRIIDALGPPKGARFIAGTNVLEQGANGTKCFGVQPPIDWTLVMDCHRALIYVRSRHGTVGGAGNSDWKRDARQHQFLAAAVAKVIANGSGAA